MLCTCDAVNNLFYELSNGRVKTLAPNEWQKRFKTVGKACLGLVAAGSGQCRSASCPGGYLLEIVGLYKYSLPNITGCQVDGTNWIGQFASQRRGSEVLGVLASRVKYVHFLDSVIKFLLIWWFFLLVCFWEDGLF